MVATLEADAEIRARPSGTAKRRLLEHKARLGRELRSWLREFGATPAARAEWAAKLAQPSFRDAVQARLREMCEAEESDGQV